MHHHDDRKDVTPLPQVMNEVTPFLARIHLPRTGNDVTHPGGVTPTFPFGLPDASEADAHAV